MHGPAGWITSLLAELRRRRVPRVAAIYLTAAFVLLQVADLVFPALGVPELAQTVLVLASILGFPLTIVCAWTFELTREGFQPTMEAGETRRRRTLTRVFSALVVTGTAVMTGVAWLAWPVPAPVAVPNAAGSGGLDRARIAVLYFDDYSPDGALRYLADGLTEGLIHELSQVEGIEVVSRNGVKPYRDSPATLDSIVRALRIGSLVEGSLTRSGDRLRLTVQLIDGATGLHLESRVFVHRMGELFALQDSLAEQVARVLRTRLGREIRRTALRSRTNSVAAWTLMQRAGEVEEDFDALIATDSAAACRALLRADSLLAEAERLDPAWVDVPIRRGWLAYTLSNTPDFAPGRYDDRWSLTALAHAERALVLDPESAEALELRGTLRADRAVGAPPDRAETLRARAETDLRRALDLDDRRARAWWTLSRLLLDSGRFAEADRAAIRTFAADAYLEVTAESIHQLYYTAINLEELDEAARWCAAGRGRYPRRGEFILCELFLMVSTPDPPPSPKRAWAVADSLVEVVGAQQRDRYRRYADMQVAKVLALAGLADSARSVIERVTGGRTPGWLAYDEAHARLLLGERAKALSFLRLHLEFDPAGAAFLADDWWFRPLWNDPGFREMIRAGGDQDPG